MYSQKVIDQNISYFEAQNGFELVRHSFSEVQEFTEYIKSIVKIGSNSKGAWIESVANLTEKRRKEIRRWVENEITLCGLDYRYWRDNYAWVVDEGGQEVKFKNRKSQDVLIQSSLYLWKNFNFQAYRF